MSEREHVIDFTVPYYDLVGITIMMKKPKVIKRESCQIVWLSDCQIVRLSDCQTDQLDAAEQISCPHLLIEAEDGAKFDPEIFQQILEVTRTGFVIFLDIVALIAIQGAQTSYHHPNTPSQYTILSWSSGLYLISDHMKLREAFPFQNGWIFGKSSKRPLT